MNYASLDAIRADLAAGKTSVSTLTEDNKPVKRDLVSTNKYRINSNGRFVSGKPVLGLLTRRR